MTAQADSALEERRLALRVDQREGALDDGQVTAALIHLAGAEDGLQALPTRIIEQVHRAIRNGAQVSRIDRPQVVLHRGRMYGCGAVDQVPQAVVATVMRRHECQMRGCPESAGSTRPATTASAKRTALVRAMSGV